MPLVIKMMKREKTKVLVLLSMFIAVSLVLGYVEFLLPNFIPIPGIKLGLANIPVIYALFKLKLPHALLISFARILILSLAFGNIFYFCFSIAGALFSILTMLLLQKTKLFTITGVSIGGGVAHNLGQICIAALLFKTPGLFYYFPFLLIAGIIAGIIIGLLSQLLINRVHLPIDLS